jgi:hypothetical protein
MPTRFQRFEQRHASVCADCGGPCGRRATRCHVCDNKSRVGNGCGENNNQWKGGRHKRIRDGYIEVLVSPYTKKLEHRVVWEGAHGPIPRGWVIHHLNGIKDDNRLENLTAMPREAHGPREHVDPEPYERRIRELEEALSSSLEGIQASRRVTEAARVRRGTTQIGRKKWVSIRN